MWYLYILLCQDGSLYTGISTNLEKRFLDHMNGKGGRYTRSHKPVKVVHSEELPTQSAALKREIQIKSWRRKRKIATLRLEY
ncbi:MAG: GIY-YIG nuclease family protein [Dehalococcoidia bacterium]|nr:GIY-YIG nuclease family protein [Dehalococcoidia bacterium]